MKKKLLLGTLLIFMYSSIYAANNYRTPYAGIGAGSYEFQVNADMFTSTGYYDHSGVQEVLDEEEAFSIINSELSLIYGYGESLQFTAGVSFRSVSASYLVDSQSVSTNHSGLESYFAGVRFSWMSGQKLHFSLDLKAAQSAYSNTDYANLSDVPSEEIILGDSGSIYEVGLGLSYLLSKSWILNLRGAYRKPGNNLASELDYLAESSWMWSTMSASVGLGGVYALDADQFTDSTDTKPIQGRAPSYMYNSINHLIVEPRIRVGWGVGSWRLDLYASQVIAGVSTDIGTRFGVQLVKTKISSKKTAKVDGSFKEYNLEATVLKVSPRGKFVQIDQGVSEDVEKGMRFDFYETDYFGGNELIASGIVYEAKLNRSIVKIVKRYTKKTIHKGFTGRARLAH